MITSGERGKSARNDSPRAAVKVPDSRRCAAVPRISRGLAIAGVVDYDHRSARGASCGRSTATKTAIEGHRQWRQGASKQRPIRALKFSETRVE